MAYAYLMDILGDLLFFCFVGGQEFHFRLPFVPSMTKSWNISSQAYKILCCFECENEKWKKATEAWEENRVMLHIMKIRRTLWPHILTSVPYSFPYLLLFYLAFAMFQSSATFCLISIFAFFVTKPFRS